MLRVLKKIYVTVFIFCIFFPFLFAHREENRVAEGENRYYANVPQIFNEDGSVNSEYVRDFEAWINDNARFRSLFRETKVTTLYKLFNYLDLENARVGTNLELYDTGETALETMQGRNLLNDSELKQYEDNIYGLQKWLERKNIDFYYMQCYHKITVLDEGYPKGLVRYDTQYIGENTEKYIEQKNRVNIVPLHESIETIAEKQNIFFRYTDWCHWNDAGMYIGYKALMEKIVERYPAFEYLTMKDYSIRTLKDYRDVYGFRYPLEETFEEYVIKEKDATEETTTFNDRLYTKSWTYHSINPTKEKKVLVIGDSFVNMNMKYHLAECFNECMTMELTNLLNIDWIIEEYKPDIVVLECLETNIPRVVGMLNELECICRD